MYTNDIIINDSELELIGKSGKNVIVIYDILKLFIIFTRVLLYRKNRQSRLLFLLGSLFITVHYRCLSQKSIKIVAFDADTEECLIGVAVYLPEIKQAYLTDAYGIALVPFLRQDSVIVTISYIGYTDTTIHLNLEMG